MTAMVAGASGLVGSELLKRVLARYAAVIALVRRPLDISHPNLEQRIIDFQQLAANVPPCDVGFCTLGTTLRKAGSRSAFRTVDHDYIVSLASSCLGAGARRFVLVSAVGANPRSRNFYLRVKGETESAVAALPFESVHLLRPGVLVGLRTEHRPGEAVAVALSRALGWALVAGFRRFRPIDAADVARAMIAAADEPCPGVHTYEYDDLLRLCAKTRD